MITPEQKKTAQDLLKLVKGEHPDLVIVPREPTDKMCEAAFKKAKFMLKGERIHPGNNISVPVYEAMIRASQEGQE